MSTSILSHFFIVGLKICAARFVNQLEDGWYVAVTMCLIPFLVVNNLNSLLVKDGPLSVNNIKCIS